MDNLTSLQRRLSEAVDALEPELVAWRRDLHRHPEPGWTEFRTSAVVVEELRRLGLPVRVGREVVRAEARMGVPPQDAIDAAFERAVAEGAPRAVVEPMAGGLTGAVARIKGGAPGPTVALRFDIDALEVSEAEGDGHRPWREGFASAHPGAMHACAHDGHTAIGLGVARAIQGVRERWPGEVVLVFQPAEEGGRGARAMVEAGVVDGCDALICAHLGIGGEGTGHLVGGLSGFLPSRKYDAAFTGREAHAGAEPHAGASALLGAANAALNLHAIPRHALGATRVNVGVLHAGTARNVVPGRAVMGFEVRGETDELLAYMDGRARAVLEGAAAMYGLGLEVEPMGAAPGAASDAEMIRRARRVAGAVPEVTGFTDTRPLGASEDATYLMRRVQERGGLATYMLIGTELSSGHHTRTFDIDEASLAIGVKAMALLALDVAARPAP
ncbi:MAG TPA: amidohydrolase [Geminicoccaceae bacterium]|nr:amidohydrolase [Geminicoccaceae bacterium]